MEEQEVKKYPYLGKKEYNGGEYVVMFTEENYGVVVMSNIQDIIALRFGNIGSYDESLFTPLEPDKCVRLSN